MDNLYNYFLRYTEKVNFLTIKNLKLENEVFKNIDIPINSDTLIKNIKENKFENEISIEYFFEGIILLNAINSNFKDIHLLNKFLFLNNDNIINFAKSKLKFSNENFNEIIYNILILRGTIILNKFDDSIVKLYIKHIIMFFDYIDDDFKSLFMNDIKIKLSEMFLKNEKDFFVNMLYGDLSLKEKFYIKSDVFYKKAFKFSEDKNIKDIISKKIDEIKPKVQIENLLQLIDKYRYEESYKILAEIDKSKLDKEDFYWIAYCYNKLNEDELSIEYYEKSLELNADFLNIFIELGLLYYKTNKTQKSLQIFENGLKYYIDDEKLLFNKIVVELKLEKFENAKDDIDRLLLYEDLDNSIMNDILYLKNIYQDRLN